MRRVVLMARSEARNAARSGAPPTVCCCNARAAERVPTRAAPRGSGWRPLQVSQPEPLPWSVARPEQRSPSSRRPASAASQLPPRATPAPPARSHRAGGLTAFLGAMAAVWLLPPPVRRAQINRFQLSGSGSGRRHSNVAMPMAGSPSGSGLAGPRPGQGSRTGADALRALLDLPRACFAPPRPAACRLPPAGRPGGCEGDHLYHRPRC